MSRTINIDREFRRGRINDCIVRHLERHRELENYLIDGGCGAPHNAPYGDWMAYQDWRDERTIMLRKLRKDCR